MKILQDLGNIEFDFFGVCMCSHLIVYTYLFKLIKRVVSFTLKLLLQNVDLQNSSIRFTCTVKEKRRTGAKKTLDNLLFHRGINDPFQVSFFHCIASMLFFTVLSKSWHVILHKVLVFISITMI